MSGCTEIRGNVLEGACRQLISTVTMTHEIVLSSKQINKNRPNKSTCLTRATLNILLRQEKMRDSEGEQGRWPEYVNFTKVIFRSHQREVCFPRGPPVLGMTSYELIGACRYGIV